MGEFEREVWKNWVKVRTPESARRRARAEMIEAKEKARVQQEQYRDVTYIIWTRGVRILQTLWIFLLGFLLVWFLYYFLFLLSFYIENENTNTVYVIRPVFDSNELVMPTVLPPTWAY